MDDRMINKISKASRERVAAIRLLTGMNPQLCQNELQRHNKKQLSSTSTSCVVPSELHGSSDVNNNEEVKSGENRDLLDYEKYTPEYDKHILDVKSVPESITPAEWLEFQEDVENVYNRSLNSVSPPASMRDDVEQVERFTLNEEEHGIVKEHLYSPNGIFTYVNSLDRLADLPEDFYDFKEPGAGTITIPTREPQHAFNALEQQQIQMAKNDKAHKMGLFDLEKSDELYPLPRDIGLESSSFTKAAEPSRSELSSNIELLTNLFRVSRICGDWLIYEYHVIITPFSRLARSTLCHVLCTEHADEIEPYVFSCKTHMIYVMQRLDKLSLHLSSIEFGKGQSASVQFNFVQELDRRHPMFQYYQMLFMKHVTDGMRFLALSCSLYNSEDPRMFPEEGIHFWPGFFGTIYYHAHGQLMIGMDPNFEVIGTQTALECIKTIQASGRDPTKVLGGKIIVPLFSKRAYLIDYIDMKRPRRLLLGHGRRAFEGYLQHIKSYYGIKVTDLEQPIIVARELKQLGCRPSQTRICFLPETCRVIGVTSSMTRSQEAMKLWRRHEILTPEQTFFGVCTFRNLLGANEKIAARLAKHGFVVAEELVTCIGRVLPVEKVIFAYAVKRAENGGYTSEVKPVLVDLEKNEWETAFLKYQMITPVALKKLALICPQWATSNVDSLVSIMVSVARKVGCNFQHPEICIRLNSDGCLTEQRFQRAVSKVASKDIDLVLIILPNNLASFRANLVRKLTSEYGILSQICLFNELKDMHKQKLLAAKLILKIAAKLGAEPWMSDYCLDDFMVVGYDVMESEESNSVGGLVATLNEFMTKCYSAILLDDTGMPFGNKLASEMRKALQAYNEENEGKYPDRIFFYRHSIEDSELEDIIEIELDQLSAMLNTYYRLHSLNPPKLTFMVVSNLDHTRLFASPKKNAPLGTIVEDTITFDYCPNFYLVSEPAISGGTVRPTHYKILYSTQGMSMQELQTITYKFCFLDFGQLSATAMPAPCMYAKKLVGSYGGLGFGLETKIHENLSTTMHFL